MPTVLTKIHHPLLIQLFSSEPCSLKRMLGFQVLLWKLWNVRTEFYIRDARTLATRNPGFLPIYLIFNHNKLLVRQNNCSLLFNSINKITDLSKEL